jgi:hypothetical protein
MSVSAEPNNNGGTESILAEGCLLSKTINNTVAMHDGPCSLTFYSICERD